MSHRSIDLSAPGLYEHDMQDMSFAPFVIELAHSSAHPEISTRISSRSESSPPLSLLISKPEPEEEEDDFFQDPPEVVLKRLRRQGMVQRRDETISTAVLEVPTAQEYQEKLETLFVDPPQVVGKSILRAQKQFFARVKHGIEFKNPFLSSERTRRGSNGGDVSPKTVFPTYDGEGYGEYDDQPGADNSEDELDQLFSHFSRPNSWTLGDHVDFVSRAEHSAASINSSYSGKYFNVLPIQIPDTSPLFDSSRDVTDSPAADAFNTSHLALRRFSGLENRIVSHFSVSDIFILSDDILNTMDIGDDVLAHFSVGWDSDIDDTLDQRGLQNPAPSNTNADDVLLGMDVEALVDDIQNTTRQFVDNDHLRGECEQNLRPHHRRPGCFCYHCTRRYGADDKEPHDATFCSCTNCFVNRYKVMKARKERTARREHADWTKKLLGRLNTKTKEGDQGKQELLDMVAKLMLDEEADQKDIVSASIKSSRNSNMFDLVKSGLRSPE
ncbi:uncharacterized protein LY89DRAFT_668622 [Mollisia scopiformis]|uniref:Uncharacterized protein n=1 Tax=Mollisia scopiformis TaxID=149040 RepID=A0A194XAU7_MOLSC|nr:uncharacterized protein LY89DRAFT_668622 [Mollisia scopiformis]KUJ17283.1 hypothetical protein LY89DRAFT_668622 [Mollisia scopiformis]